MNLEREPRETSVRDAGSSDRTFRAPDSRTALQAVKAALGADAVIVACREVKGGLFGGREIEVVARRANDPAPTERAPEPEDEDIQIALRKAAANRARRALDDVRGRQRSDAWVRATPPRADIAASEDDDVDAGPRELTSGVRARLLATLVERGLDDGLATGVLERAVLDPRDGHERHLARVARVLREMVTTSRAPWTPDPTGERNVIALVGPTGVGKTTTAAKIAARASIDFSQKVALITTDSYRVGAVQQIARYGELIDVPTFVARDGNELARALDTTSDCDLVIIDTAGRSPKDHRTLAHQMSLLRAVPGLVVTWCVPSATSAPALSTFQQRSIELAPDRVIVTKVDEAHAPGTMLNIVGRIDAPLSCITDGQRIFEDLHAPSVAQVVHHIVPQG